MGVADGSHFIVEDHDACVGVFNPGLDDHFVVEPGGPLIAAVGLGHGEEYSVVTLHIAVVEAASFAEIDAAHFHPDEVVRIVHHTHLVSFGVAHAQAGFGGWWHGKSIVTP